MKNSLLTGQFIKDLIDEDEKLKDTIGAKKVFPLIANQNTDFPYIVYERSSLQPDYTKDGNSQDTVYISLMIYSDDYESSINITNYIRELVEFNAFPDYDITEIYVQDIKESLEEFGYSQTLYLKIIYN